MLVRFSNWAEEDLKCEGAVRCSGFIQLRVWLIDCVPSDSRVSSFGVGEDAGEPLEASRVEGEGEDLDVPGVKGARVVGSESGAYVREVVESAR